VNNNVAPPGEDAIQELVRLAPLEGPVYLKDKRHIYRIIRDVVSVEIHEVHRENKWMGSSNFGD